jgi:hypothetical protein
MATKKKITVKKHFVIFLSPGTLFSEETSKPIDKWDVALAIKMSSTIVERYSATPYGFYFLTVGRGKNDLNSKELKRSNMYYLGGKIETLKEVEARNDPKDRILLANMRCNGYDKIIVNTNSWKSTFPFDESKDVILDYTPPKRGKFDG